MNKYIVLILLNLTALVLQAADNPLIGQWIKEAENEIMQVKFSADTMTISSSVDKVKTSRTMAIQYKKQEASWMIEMLSDQGEIQGKIQAIIVDADHIKFGVPNSVFYDYRRVK